MFAQSKNTEMAFPTINLGFNSVFNPGKLSLGLVIPIENYDNTATPTMEDHLERVLLAEALGFSALWLRDVPFNVPSFGDAGQMFDPFVYLGLLAGQTKTIALGVASIILPLRHPAHTAKAAASVDVLSAGRLILGVASGDRPEEYPAMNISYSQRGKLFRDSYEYIRGTAKAYPKFKNSFGTISRDMDMLPKPESERLPLLITGSSQQSPEWLAANVDGWISYPRPTSIQEQFIHQLRDDTKEKNVNSKPFMEPLYIDLTGDPNSPPKPIHLGYRVGAHQLLEYLKSREEIGVNHVALNLRFNTRNIEETLQEIASTVLPHFNE